MAYELDESNGAYCFVSYLRLRGLNIDDYKGNTHLKAFLMGMQVQRLFDAGDAERARLPEILPSEQYR